MLRRLLVYLWTRDARRYVYQCGRHFTDAEARLKYRIAYQEMYEGRREEAIRLLDKQRRGEEAYLAIALRNPAHKDAREATQQLNLMVQALEAA